MVSMLALIQNLISGLGSKVPMQGSRQDPYQDIDTTELDQHAESRPRFSPKSRMDSIGIALAQTMTSIKNPQLGAQLADKAIFGEHERNLDAWESTGKSLSEKFGRDFNLAKAGVEDENKDQATDLGWGKVAQDYADVQQRDRSLESLDRWKGIQALIQQRNADANAKRASIYEQEHKRKVEKDRNDANKPPYKPTRTISPKDEDNAYEYAIRIVASKYPELLEHVGREQSGILKPKGDKLKYQQFLRLVDAEKQRVLSLGSPDSMNSGDDEEFDLEELR